MESSEKQNKKMTVLKILRKSMRLSQEELAEKLGSHIKRIRRCESLNPNQNRELELTVAEWQRFSKLVWDQLKLDLPFVPEIRLSDVPSDEFYAMLTSRGIKIEHIVRYSSKQNVQ
jgi:transcriptional regulator with XRE-family HTH domain